MMKAEDVFKPKIGPIMGGLITDPLPAKVRKLEERVSDLEKLAHTNPSGCCCKFAEDGETLIEVCKAYQAWKDREIKWTTTN